MQHVAKRFSNFFTHFSYGTLRMQSVIGIEFCFILQHELPFEAALLRKGAP